MRRFLLTAKYRRRAMDNTTGTSVVQGAGGVDMPAAPRDLRLF